MEADTSTASSYFRTVGGVFLNTNSVPIIKEDNRKKKKYKDKLWVRLGKDLVTNKSLYLMLLPVILYYIVFCYLPIYGAQIAFRDFKPRFGVLGSEWVGFENFVDFFKSVYFTRLIRNTLMINVLNLLIGFPAPILLALLLNEVRNLAFKKTVQTVSYLPHFISTVVVSGMIMQFVSTEGFITKSLTFFGVPQNNLLTIPEFFRSIYISSDIWQGIGWGSIIYIAAIAGINPELYEAAKIDGAGRIKQILHITLPGILSTIITLFILRIGTMMSLGYEKIILLYNPSIYETADVISTFVYRKGLLDLNYSFSTAVDLFNSVINLTLLFSANKIARKLTSSSLW